MSQTCDQPSNVIHTAGISILFIENYNVSQKLKKSPVANIRKMLLMKDRCFLYELRAYLVYEKVGEYKNPS